MAYLMTDYTRRKDHQRMAKDKMIEMLDIIAMYTGEFLFLMGATRLGVFDEMAEFFQRTAHEKGLAVDGHLLMELSAGNAMVMHEMDSKTSGDFA